MPKKPHWTQTPEGRKIQSRRMKLQHKNGSIGKHKNEVTMDDVELHIGKEPKLNYSIIIKSPTSTIKVTEVPRRTVLNIMGNLMKGK